MNKQQNLIVGQHYPAIDGLRGIAVLLVLWFHSSYFITIDMDAQLSGFTYGYYLLTILGETGVDLFFVLSGFLITGILIDTANDKQVFRNFYIRRSLRIFPLYYAVLFIFIAYFSIIFGVNGLDSGKIFAHLFYVQNWSLTHNNDQFILLDHTWSLAVEEQFYLFWPLLFLSFYNKGSVRNVLILCAVMVLASWCMRLFFTDLSQYKWAYTFTISRLDGLAFGALLSILCANYMDKCKKYNKFLPYVMIITFIAILFVLFSPETKMGSHHAMIRYGLILFAIFYVSLLAYIFLSKENNILKRFFSLGCFRGIGKVSYGVYIFHSPVMMIIVRQIDLDMGYWKGHLILLLSGTVISFVLASISYRYFEKPILRLKDKYAPLQR